jgi:hypothetical protein
MTISDAPHVRYGGDQIDYRRLYRSDRRKALIRELTLQAGYGVLKPGTVLAKNESAAGNVGKYVPYNPTVFTSSKELQAGKAFLVSDSGTGGAIVYVTMDDSYKFAVGDDLIVNSDGETAENMGAITAIDRSTYPHMAAITATTNISNDHTVANSAYVIVEAGDSSNNYSDAVCILEKAVDTGTGETAQGALGTAVLKNAILYKGMLINYDAAALADLGSSDDGQLTIL